MIKFISGDILKAKETYIAQGVAEGNQEGLGTGLALKICTAWPEVQSKFKRYARLGRFRAGDIFVVAPTVSSPGLIYLATQPDRGAGWEKENVMIFGSFLAFLLIGDT
jgi:O-acetyl-ADP-ribose deacetylase (regulator of RNase III)